MADERKLNEQPSMKKDYYYYYYSLRKRCTHTLSEHEHDQGRVLHRLNQLQSPERSWMRRDNILKGYSVF